VTRAVASDPRRPYEAFGAAKQLWTDRRPEVLLSGPAGTGKSRACLEKLHAVCLRWPRSRCLIVRKTRESLTETGLVTFEEKVLPEGSPVASGAQRRVRQSYTYPNGSSIVVGGMDKATKIMSTEYDLIYVQEAIELLENDWESLTTRLRNAVVPFQQLIADTNPDSPRHWLKLRCDRGSTAMLDSRHEDNPTLWDRAAGDWLPRGVDYIRRLDALTGARKPRLRYGKWVQAEGAIYEDWDRNEHLVDRFEIPKGWRRIRSIDFGFVNPFSCQWWAIDGDGRMYLYREIYRTKRIVADHAREIARLSEGETYEFTVCDHDAEDRATLLAGGIGTIPARKEVLVGIQATQDRLRDPGDGRPRLVILRDSLVGRDEALVEAKKPFCTEQEIDGYIWSNNGIDGKPLKEEPLKINDHGCDAMRYAVMAVDRGVLPIEPDDVRAAREAREEAEAEAAYRDINADHWWS
jgi:PBSX family phage terminase large subunit